VVDSMEDEVQRDSYAVVGQPSAHVSFGARLT
jgi:hypothetical protein